MSDSDDEQPPNPDRPYHPIVRVPRPPGFGLPERDAPPSMRPETAEATMEKLEDANGNEVVVFDSMGRSAVERMTNVTYAGGDRGRTLVSDSTTDARCLFDFVAASSGVDTFLLRGAKEGCPHATPVLLKWLGDAFAALRPSLPGTVYLAGVLGHAETTAGGTRLAAVHALAKRAPNVVVLEELFSRKEPLLERPPYDNAVGRRDFYEELEVTVHEAELSKCHQGTLVLFDWVVDSGEKSKFFRAEAAKLAEALGKDVQIVVIAAGKRVGAMRRTPTAASLLSDFLRDAKAAVALSLANQGLRSMTEGAFGGGIYKIDVVEDLADVEGVAKVYGGSHKAGPKAWKARGQLLCEAVDEDDAAEARLQADLLMRGRGVSHQSAARCRKKPAVFQRMWDECRRVIDKDFHVRQRMRCVAFIISFEGETEAEFYQRLLNLEQGLLDHLFDLMDRVHRCGHFRASTVAPIDRRTKPTNTSHTGKQLYIANRDRQACCGAFSMVRDEDGSWVHCSQTRAAKQKFAATLAAKKDGEYVACITDLLTAADDGAEAEALEALLGCAERVDEAATAERPELRLERADAAFIVEVIRWAERAAEGDEVDDALAVLEAATAVTFATTPEAKASERVVRDEMHGAAAETWPVLQSSFIQVLLQRPIVFSQKLSASHRHASSSQAALKETHLELCGVVDPEQGGKKVLSRFTCESRRRAMATNAARTCVAEAAAAVARAQAEGDADLKVAAHAYSVAATDLRDACPEKQGDMHILFRAAAASYRASVASAKAVGDDAAVAQKLVEASNAFDVAAKAVVDAVDFDTKLEARGDLEAAEDALKNLFSGTTEPRKPAPRKTANRPRPNTRTDRSSKKRVVASQAHRQRKRCGTCAGCLAEECGECRFCLDMTKRGGPGVLRRKPCIERACLVLKAQPPPSRAHRPTSNRVSPDVQQSVIASNRVSSRRRRRGRRSVS